MTAVAAGVLGTPLLARSASGWRAGVASADITPGESIWMAGYAARTQPSQGVALPLHAKALALDDGRGGRVVMVSLDLLGVTGAMSRRIADAVARTHGLSPESLLLNASHTHCGPVVDDQLLVAYDLSDAQTAVIRAYTATLERRVTDLVGQALSGLRAARLFSGEGAADFAANRRVKHMPDGPVDHRVPVLRVETDGGAPMAVVFGYACHNTTLQANFVQLHGDYAGVARAALEARHPGTVALFLAGCGGDANPAPRGTIELATRHGTALADAVDRAMRDLAPVDGPLRAARETVDLPFAAPPDRARWRERLADADQYVRRHARLMLETLERDGRLPAVQPLPVQVWRFGRDLTLVTLGGEVVVDYALRLARELRDRRVWVAGYSNDVFGYLPSRRVLDEGGYEGGGAMIYYGKPGPFDATVEERVIAGVKRLAERTSR